jgi:hypothetical protein
MQLDHERDASEPSGVKSGEAAEEWVLTKDAIEPVLSD